MSAQSFSRSDALARMGQSTFDLLVIGGGVTGAGVALDAAARGLSTALVEKLDLGSGTSSKSSKLVHGGLRYLQQHEYLLVAENLAERQRLLTNAPHLVSTLPFLIPLFGRDGVVNKTVAKAYSTALWMYDLAGGMRIGKRHRRIHQHEAAALMPSLRMDRLVAGFIYYDARTDDARLTLALARSAALDHGAVIANYAPVDALLRDERGQVTGARVVPMSGTNGLAEGGPIDVRARVVINATGVWADDVRQMALRRHPDTIRPAKGVHITFPADKLPCEVASVIPVPGDRRSIFVIPWGNRTYVGTTDTDYQGPLDDPQCTAEDVAYLLSALNAALTEPLSEDDVVGSWAGLRPLIKSAASDRTADLSRRHAVFTGEDGLITVTGGKLTTYRKMAADAVDAATKQLRSAEPATSTRAAHGPMRGSLRRGSTTKHLALHGAQGSTELRNPQTAQKLGISPAVLEHLVSRHGNEAPSVAALARSQPGLAEALVPGLPYLAAEAVWAARHEMAHTLEDVLSRRTRALLLDRQATMHAAPAVASLLAGELGWDAEEEERQVGLFRALVDHEQAVITGAEVKAANGNAAVGNAASGARSAAAGVAGASSATDPALS
jgi:glycerol-3-phosphate dehydrogenase